MTITPAIADLIRAVLDGKTVQYMKRHAPEQWCDYTHPTSAIMGMLSASPTDKFRLKPEPVTKTQALAAINELQRVRCQSEPAWGILRRFIEEQAW